MVALFKYKYFVPFCCLFVVYSLVNKPLHYCRRYMNVGKDTTIESMSGQRSDGSLGWYQSFHIRLFFIFPF